ncbi:MAG TPA: FAD-binding protein, partial [Burkholderiales bacterium]|nr:FAD-binding protein [Burkholderiales bacterium]
MTDPAGRYAAKRDALAAQFRAGAGSIGLAKDTSNLFRDRSREPGRRLDVREFSEVLHVDRETGFVEAEGMVPYEALADACLVYAMMPAVVPQLKTITLGGAVAGVGIEASSHRYGLVHESVQTLDVLAADGRVYACTPDNEHADLFYGFPNSYGTLGYALRVKARTVPVKPYVHLEHLPFKDASSYFRILGEKLQSGEADFVDGVVFGPREMVLTLGRFADDAPYTSDYTFEHVYYRSLRERRE